MSSLHYQIPIDSIPLSVAVYQFVDDDFVFIDFNLKAELTEGIKKSELLGKKLCDVFPGVKSFGLYDVLLRIHKNGGHETFDDAHYTDDRISGWRKNEIIKLPNGNVMAMYEDVTQIKQLEEENRNHLRLLQESEEKFRTIAENSLMGIFIYEEECYSYVNDAFVSLVGYSKEELYTMKVWDILDKPYQKKVKEIAKLRVLGKQFPYTHQDIKLITKSGQLKTIRASTKTITYRGHFAGMGTIIDITDIKETKEQLKILAQAIEQTDDLVKIINKKGEIVFANDSVLKHSGYTQSELFGAHTRIFKSGYHEPSFYTHLWKTVASGKIYRDTFVNKKKNGSLFYEEETITPIFDENKKIEYFVSTGKDISKRVELENALRESETNFRNIFNKSSDGIVIHDLKGNFLEVNSVICNRLGYSKEEMIGKNLTFIDTPKAQKNIPATAKALQENGHVMFEGEHRKKDGGLIPVEIHATIIEYMNSVAVLSVVRDITERKQNEQALHDAEELYHTLFDLSPVGILVIDPDTGKAVEFNTIAYKVLGYSAQEFAELAIKDYEVHETPEETAKHIEKLKMGTFELFETQHRTKNGNILDMVISVQLITIKERFYLFAVYQDITSLKAYERTLKTLSLRLSLATQAAAIGVWEWDLKSNTLIWDDQMYLLYGIKKNLDRQPYAVWRDAVDHNDIDRMEASLRCAIAGEGDFNTRFWITTPHQERRFIQAIGRVERDDKGDPFRIVGVNWDITKQKKYEQFLEFSKLEAETTKTSLEQQAKVLEEYAFLDPLTHLPNRRKFDEVFDAEWRRALRNQAPLSICMIDIDFFKGYNDALGHGQGDICLEQVASAIYKSSAREGELAARYGGEEFIVLLPNSDISKAYQSAEHIRKSVEMLLLKHPHSSVSSVVTVSVGCASIYPAHKIVDKKGLMRLADKALYLAKQNGRNRVHFLTEDEDEAGLERLLK